MHVHREGHINAGTPASQAGKATRAADEKNFIIKIFSDFFTSLVNKSSSKPRSSASLPIKLTSRVNNVGNEAIKSSHDSPKPPPTIEELAARLGGRHELPMKDQPLQPILDTRLELLLKTKLEEMKQYPGFHGDIDETEARKRLEKLPAGSSFVRYDRSSSEWLLCENKTDFSGASKFNEMPISLGYAKALLADKKQEKHLVPVMDSTKANEKLTEYLRKDSTKWYALIRYSNRSNDLVLSVGRNVVNRQGENVPIFERYPFGNRTFDQLMRELPKEKVVFLNSGS